MPFSLNNTLDGRNPAPPGMYETLWIMRYLLYQLEQDFFHQQYVLLKQNRDLLEFPKYWNQFITSRWPKESKQGSILAHEDWIKHDQKPYKHCCICQWFLLRTWQSTRNSKGTLLTKHRFKQKILSGKLDFRCKLQEIANLNFCPCHRLKKNVPPTSFNRFVGQPEGI